MAKWLSPKLTIEDCRITKKVRTYGVSSIAVTQFYERLAWAAAGFKDTESGVLIEPEVGTTEVYAGVKIEAVS